MNPITEAFFIKSKIERTVDAEGIMDFLCSPESINKMIIMAELGLPSLTGIVKDLEEKFGDSATFPLNHIGENENAKYRQNVGRMIKFVMREFGYIPSYSELGERVRLREFAQSKYFSTAAVYEKSVKSPRYNVKIEVTSRS